MPALRLEQELPRGVAAGDSEDAGAAPAGLEGDGVGQPVRPVPLHRGEELPVVELEAPRGDRLRVGRVAARFDRAVVEAEGDAQHSAASPRHDASAHASDLRVEPPELLLGRLRDHELRVDRHLGGELQGRHDVVGVLLGLERYGRFDLVEGCDLCGAILLPVAAGVVVEDVPDRLHHRHLVRGRLPAGPPLDPGGLELFHGHRLRLRLRIFEPRRDPPLLRERRRRGVHGGV
mmetsp:Transcript_6582/g.16021  ORF Transcript_6582/g.16021 Transcript_6582/m.16021 type:complete len:233 (-) Transcript_6582:116-814(-)